MAVPAKWWPQRIGKEKGLGGRDKGKKCGLVGMLMLCPGEPEKAVAEVNYMSLALRTQVCCDTFALLSVPLSENV